jgi:hypothetical protein
VNHVSHDVVNELKIGILLIVNEIHLHFEGRHEAGNVDVVGFELLHDSGHAILSINSRHSHAGPY